MAVFRWQGVSPRGDVLAGEMEAPTRDAVLVRLRSQRIQPIPAKIKEKGRRASFTSSALPFFSLMAYFAIFSAL